MNRATTCTLLFVALFTLGISAATQDTPAPLASVDSSSSLLPLQTSLKLGTSLLFYTPFGRFSRPVTIGMSMRIVELVEPTATLLLGNSIAAQDGTEKVPSDRVLAFALEIRLSPEFWNWYRPSIGIGWFYSEHWPNVKRDLNEGMFFSMTMLGLAPHKMAVSIKRGGTVLHLQPIVSAGDARLGPILPWGKRWSDNSGNYYFEMTLLSLGVIWW